VSLRVGVSGKPLDLMHAAELFLCWWPADGDLLATGALSSAVMEDVLSLGHSSSKNAVGPWLYLVKRASGIGSCHDTCHALHKRCWVPGYPSAGLR